MRRKKDVLESSNSNCIKISPVREHLRITKSKNFFNLLLSQVLGTLTLKNKTYLALFETKI